MAKVLIITTINAGVGLSDARAALDTLGIEHDTLVVMHAGHYAPIQPIAGITSALNPSSATMRNLLRQYDAVLVINPLDATSNWNGFDPTLNTWLSWNEPQDPPVIHFGEPITTARTGLSLPNDFPIIRGNTNDIANTMWRWEPGLFAIVALKRNRIGTRVTLTREGTTVYTRSYNFWWGNECAAYLVLSDLLIDSSISELLAYPSFPDQSRVASYPADKIPAFAVRYRKHYFLPALWTTSNQGLRLSNHMSPGFRANNLFWLLYGLKLAGVAPARRIPVVLEFDHFAETHPNARDLYNRTYLQQVQMERDTYQWLVSFCKPRGLQIPFGNSSAGRYAPETATGSFWNYLFRGDGFPPADRAAGRAICAEIHQLLLSHPEVFGCGIHDHSAPGGRFNGTRYSTNAIIRHSDAGYQYAAPNAIPTRHGSVINAKVAPSTLNTPYRFRLQGETYLDINPPTSTAASYNAQDGNRWTARMLIERAKHDHDGLGLSIKGTADYTNNAGNQHGGLGFLETFLEFGFRGLRIDLNDRPVGHPSGDPRNLRYGSLQLIPTAWLDMCFGAAGFYHASATYENTMFGAWGLEIGTELRGANNEWMTNLTWRQEKGVVAIRRYLSAALDNWLWTVLVLRGTGYLHPGEIVWNDPSAILSEPFTGDTGNQVWTGAFNPIRELLLGMDAIIRVLGNYLKWGTIAELMDVREEVVR